MERLTYVTENGEILFHPEDLPEDEGMTIRQLAIHGRWEELNQIAEKLTNMEQLEEQGLLVRLPCKVGDVLYCIDNGIVETLIVNSFRIYNFNRVEIDFENASGFTLCTFAGELDEGYFLSHEEAEKKLEELKNEI